MVIKRRLGGHDMTAEIVDLGLYRQHKERGQLQTPKASEDPPPQVTQDSDTLSHDDETA
jgi:hypothetical protein